MELEFVNVQKAAEILNVSPDTIRRWEKKGLIKAIRTENNHRIFNIADLQEIKKKQNSSDRGFYILHSPKESFKTIELFSGAGGLALGLENAGFQTKLLVEINKDAVATLRKNRPNWNIFEGDIKHVDFTQFRDKIDVVIGGFPCQAFSYAGKGLGFEDTRGTLFFEFARCINEVRPKIAVGENVKGLLKHDNGKTLTTMLNTLKELGYRPYYKLLQAQFYDVPQKRDRLMIVGVREDLSNLQWVPKERNYYLSIKDALTDCPKSEYMKYSPKKQKVLELVPPGGCWRDLPLEIQKEYMGVSFYQTGGRTGMARRLSWNEPSLTLTCNPAQKQTERCHPSETRPLTVREYARIQTFPDEWDFAGALTSKYKQIGNAVPVNLGYHIGKCLIAMLKNQFDPNTLIKMIPEEQYLLEI